MKNENIMKYYIKPIQNYNACGFACQCGNLYYCFCCFWSHLEMCHYVCKALYVKIVVSFIIIKRETKISNKQERISTTRPFTLFELKLILTINPMVGLFFPKLHVTVSITIYSLSIRFDSSVSSYKVMYANRGPIGLFWLKWSSALRMSARWWSTSNGGCKTTNKTTDILQVQRTQPQALASTLIEDLTEADW